MYIVHSCLSRSGTEEEFDEKEQLLLEVSQLSKERETISKGLKNKDKEREAAITIRKRAMESLSPTPSTSTAAGDESEASDYTGIYELFD